MLIGCNGIDNPEGDLKDVKLEDWPLTDCSTWTDEMWDEAWLILETTSF